MFAVYLKIFHVTRVRARRNLAKTVKFPSQKQPTTITQLVCSSITSAEQRRSCFLSACLSAKLKEHLNENLQWEWLKNYR